MQLFFRCVDQFWNRHPALLYGIAALIGCGIVFSSWKIHTIPLFFILIYLLHLTRTKRKKAACLSAVIAFFTLTCLTSYTFPTLPQGGVSGWGKLEIHSIGTQEKFAKLWAFQCTLKEFTNTQGEISARNIPCRVYLPAMSKRPKAFYHYVVFGRLKQSPFGGYTFSAKKGTHWKPQKATWGFPELRYETKSAVKSLIKTHISKPQSAQFLSGISTGDFEDPMIAFDLSRFGLLHIMAISGFHFALIATLLNIFLSLFLPKKPTTYLLIFLMSSYFLFIGPSASILRAWIMVLIALSAHLFEKESSSLNTLGLALILMLLYDPLLSKTIGFQFSFLSTAAILLLTSPIDNLLSQFLKKRTLPQVLKMNRWNQHGYILLTFIRKALALSLAVNSVVIPYMLFTFHRFPLMGLLYNLFFPLFVSLVLTLLLLGFLFLILYPPLGNFLLFLTNHATQWMLNTTQNMPMTLDFVWRVKEIDSLFLMGYFSLLFLLAIYLQHRQEERIQQRRDFALV